MERLCLYIYSKYGGGRGLCMGGGGWSGGNINDSKKERSSLLIRVLWLLCSWESLDTVLYRARICRLLRSPGIDSQPGGPLRKPYMTYRPAGLFLGIDSWAPWTFTSADSDLSLALYVVLFFWMTSLFGRRRMCYYLAPSHRRPQREVAFSASGL